jgi:hypothetical protein
MRDQEIIGLWEAYQQVHAQEKVEQLDEARTDPRGRPASGPMSVYGGKGTPSPDPEGDDNVSRMDRAQRRVKRTQPRAKGMAADSLFTKYSARQTGGGGEEGPGPNAPRRGGRSGRGANTDRGSGNAAARRMSEEFDLFDIILEHLVAEGYANTNEAALAIMANMSEEWREDIMEISDKRVMAARNALAKRTDRSVGMGDGNQYSKNVSREARMNARIQSRNQRTGSNVEPTFTRRHQ